MNPLLLRLEMGIDSFRAFGPVVPFSSSSITVTLEALGKTSSSVSFLKAPHPPPGYKLMAQSINK